MTEIVEQKIVSGCKNPFRTFYIAVMHYGVWLLIFLRKEQMQMKLVLAEKPSVAMNFSSLKCEFYIPKHSGGTQTAKGPITLLFSVNCLIVCI